MQNLNSRVVTVKPVLKSVKKYKRSKYQYPYWKSMFLRWMLDNPEEQTYHLWLGAGNTLAYFGEAGRAAFHELSCRYPGYCEDETNRLFEQVLASYRQRTGPITYEKLAEYGYDEKDDTNAASPAIFIKKIWQDEVLQEMGLIWSKKSNKAQFNPNVFAKYLMKCCQLVICEGNMFYKYAEGVWSPITVQELKRKIWEEVQNVKENIYTPKMGEEAVEILKLAVPSVKEMNVSRIFINLENGMFNLENFLLHAHDPTYYSTIQTPIIYDHNAKCNQFIKFIEEIMEGDAERIAVLQEIIGYLLTAFTIIHKVFFFYGEGSNGKSVLLEIITMLVGRDNISNLTLQDLDDSFNRAVLIGKTVNITTENEGQKSLIVNF